ncbi:hypothetical protein H8A95_09155 [Bradyrhizobium sp. Pear76]|uniref:hypothetical protein n=1 Tax=Bradyrhizobium oropedii TaxID=1571201 RepID=UPI001E3F13DD|nr:hypothetical protein [Bradyrhizobium oropedii]MCC8962476.1 hypothetical protein [Bradyrhizobium oropedii]
MIHDDVNQIMIASFQSCDDYYHDRRETIASQLDRGVQVHKQFFMLHGGHLVAKADRIARRYGGRHVNTIDAGQARGWFEVPSTGGLIDNQRITIIRNEIERAGGVESLRRKRPLKAA